jgi:hypothetical protein
MRKTDIRILLVYVWTQTGSGKGIYLFIYLCSGIAMICTAHPIMFG